jgi:hypothetical protein
MKRSLVRSVCAVVLLATAGLGQDVIHLYSGPVPGPTQENYPEKEYFSKIWNTEVVTNVTQPSLLLFNPSQGSSTAPQ